MCGRKCVHVRRGSVATSLRLRKSFSFQKNWRTGVRGSVSKSPSQILMYLSMSFLAFVLKNNAFFVN
jgi:hypothetical protein